MEAVAKRVAAAAGNNRGALTLRSPRMTGRLARDCTVNRSRTVTSARKGLGMHDEPNTQMSEETREFLGDLTRDDIAMLKKGLPILRAVLGFGTVTKWLAITFLGILAGVVLLGETLSKIGGWISRLFH